VIQGTQAARTDERSVAVDDISAGLCVLRASAVNGSRRSGRPAGGGKRTLPSGWAGA